MNLVGLDSWNVECGHGGVVHGWFQTAAAGGHRQLLSRPRGAVDSHPPSNNTALSVVWTLDCCNNKTSSFYFNYLGRNFRPAVCHHLLIPQASLAPLRAAANLPTDATLFQRGHRLLVGTPPPPPPNISPVLSPLPCNCSEKLEQSRTVLVQLPETIRQTLQKGPRANRRPPPC